MTKLLYDLLPYDKDFSAKVISCEEAEDDNYKIVLDQTLFFPEQGGQTSDIGFINDVEVTDVQIEAGTIFHYANRPLKEDSQVEGHLNWEHRFNNMQQHSGEHIFTGLAHREFGANNVGFHLSDNTVTLDLDVELDQEKISFLEKKANIVIAENHRIKCYYPTEEELAVIDYRSKKEIDGAIRLVEIEDVDICACCAPHVLSTGSVGILKVINFEKYKGGTRVYILCGMRALQDYCKKQNLIEETYRTLGCSADEISDKAKALMADSRNTRLQLSQLKAKQLLSQIEKYPSELKDVIIYTDDMDAKTIRDGVNILTENHEGLCGIFNGNDENGYSFVIGSRTRDCGAIVAGLRSLLGAKGGGSKQMAQGAVNCTRADLERNL